METPLAADVLILADATTAQRWAAILQGPQIRIWLASADVPDPERLDVIVTNRGASVPPEPGIDGGSGPAQGELGAVGAGVIRIGTQGAADVHLPADVTERELRLACRLLAEIVGLRRRQLTGSRLHRRLEREALTDPVTGLPNRRAWDQALPDRLTTAASLPGRLCVVIIDLDHFKRINDSRGYTVGDTLLRAAGETISKSLRREDFVARLGGDEFGLLLAVPDPPTARAVVDRVRRTIPTGLARAGSPAVKASAGFHLAPSGDPAAPLPSPDVLFDAADAALRQAKRQGRDRTVGQ